MLKNALIDVDINCYERNYDLADDEYIKLYIFAAKYSDSNGSAQQVERLFDSNKMTLK